MTSGPPVDQFDMNPEAVHARFEWAARQGDPKWLWPATTVRGWRAALTAIGQATRIVLNEGRAATLEKGRSIRLLLPVDRRERR